MAGKESTPTRSVSEGTGSRTFAALAQKISAWTTNLLASAIVLVLGLVLGWQVLTWWHDQPNRSSGSLALSTGAAPTLDGRELLTRHGTLAIRRVEGSREAALAAMLATCQDMQGETAATPAGAAASPSEQRLLDQFRNQASLAESDSLALYQPPGKELMVAAVNREHTRIVGWCFALPSGDNAWSIYHCRSTSLSPVQTSSTAGARP